MEVKKSRRPGAAQWLEHSTADREGCYKLIKASVCRGCYHEVLTAPGPGG